MTDSSSPAPIVEYNDENHKYKIDGLEVKSVTQILDLVTPKNALTWWGMRVGIAGVIKLLQTNTISWPVLQAHVYEEVIDGTPVHSPKIKNKQGKEKTVVEQDIIANKLSSNHIRDTAADRGTLIHDALQRVGIEDQLPDLGDFIPEHRGYIQAFAKWWLNEDPTFERQEVIVAHRELQYAGRFDLTATIRGKKALVDFKTSKFIYESHYEQLRLYDIGDRYMGQWESSYAPHEDLWVVRLDRDGSYEMASANFVSPITATSAVMLAQCRLLDARTHKLGNQFVNPAIPDPAHPVLQLYLP